MSTVQIKAWTKADNYGVRSWDVTWTDDLGRERGQCFRTTQASLEERFLASGYSPRVEIPVQPSIEAIKALDGKIWVSGFSGGRALLK